MNKILAREQLNSETVLMDIEAPLIARKALPGQFIIFRVDEEGERVPLTIAGTDPESGSVRIIFQMVGKSTIRLGDKQVGDTLASFVGPLGKPSELDEYAGKRVAVIGGGLGMAIAYPQAAYLHQIGAQIDVIAGFRTRDLIILEKEMKAVSDRFHLITDDGSSGRKGFVTHVLEDLIKEGAHFDLVLAIGPLVMMRAVANLTRSHGIKTIVSMNTIMVDGTGMCGCCRLTVDGQVKFACVDGPDFDGHQVDFDESIRRSRAYLEQEAFDREEELKLHRCRLTGEVRHG
ncbi:MAG TPA: sulfide/dihydroorotate dehydrogenase-like FAD/NAD-binding protein [Bacillota bacterium]|nr:sulfide/dihydroorotate dehydrogenase-like FAD/NAD-binding protein [Fastidiosipila sp.]HQB80753.1 sulfide/dihydroorotate dehydrogenase-like FAD/NAD-binding protein [Bacillota bacterium]